MGAVPSGMCSIDEVLKIGGNFNLPFGGIGLSGMVERRQVNLVLTYSVQSEHVEMGSIVWLVHPPFDAIH